MNFDLIIFTIATGLNAELAINTVRIPTYETFARHLHGRGKVLVVTDCVTTAPEFLALFTHPRWLDRRIRKRGIDRRSDNLFTYTPLVPVPLSIWERLPRVLRDELGRTASWDLRSVMRRIGMGNARRVVSVNDPRLHFIPGLVQESLLIYDCLDDYALYGWETQAGKVLERECKLVQKADIVFVTSRPLYDKMCAQHERVHYFPNAVDFEFFNRATHHSTPTPPALEKIPRPIVGFMGALCHWYDYALLRSVIEERPTWSFVFIGWADSLPEIAAIRRMSNVYFLGTQEFEELPSFLKGFDVAIMPYKLNASGRSVNPDKMYQYMAAGVPIVATPTPEIAQYAEVIDVAERAEDLVLAIEHRLLQGRQDSRLSEGIAIARENTWDRRIGDELAIMEASL